MSIWKRLFGMDRGRDDIVSAANRAVEKTNRDFAAKVSDSLSKAGHNLSDEGSDDLLSSGFQNTGGPFSHYTGIGEYEFDIVGESHYQDALERIAGPRTDAGVEFECVALLICENDNPYDKNAVAVTINDEKVGYLSRDDAVEWRELLADEWVEESPVTVDALIVGGWDRGANDKGSYGVKLDID